MPWSFRKKKYTHDNEHKRRNLLLKFQNLKVVEVETEFLRIINAL
jgi:hypothetical protein